MWCRMQKVYILANVLEIPRFVYMPIIFMMVALHARLWQLVEVFLLLDATITDKHGAYLSRSIQKA